MKNKLQNVDFRTVGEFLDFLPENELRIVERLREIIFDCIPDVEEKLAYNVPYYWRHSRICFIWPASVMWGNVKLKGVRLGFTKGNLLENSNNYLVLGNRKEVAVRDFYSLDELETDVIKSYLFEAAMLDEEFAKSKKRKMGGRT
jgi:hypothetical protein